MELASAVSRLKNARESDYGETFDATRVRGLADSTLDAYIKHLNWLLRAAKKNPESRARALVEGELLSLFNRCHTAAGIGQLLSGIGLVEKLGWIELVVRRADWLLVEMVARMQERNKIADNKCWASIAVITAMADMAVSFQDWETVALAAISSVLLLRISEAAAVHLISRDGVPMAQFEGTKSRRGTTQSAIGRWAGKWLQFLTLWRATYGHHPDRPASFTGAAGL